MPVNIDAIIFWVVWNAEKYRSWRSCSYVDAITLSAQTALRELNGTAQHDLARGFIRAGNAGKGIAEESWMRRKRMPRGVSCPGDR